MNKKIYKYIYIDMDIRNRFKLKNFYLKRKFIKLEITKKKKNDLKTNFKFNFI
jgi:hypothetical protein